MLEPSWFSSSSRTPTLDWSIFSEEMTPLARAQYGQYDLLKIAIACSEMNF